MSGLPPPARHPLVAAVVAGLLLLAAGAVALLTGVPAIFPSLGPTAFVQVETPEQPAARPWNVAVGHLVGAVAGYLAVLLTGSASQPSVLATAEVTPPRVAAAVIAVVLTLLGCAALRANHPPAAATTLLVALGGFAALPAGPVALAVGVAVVLVLGEVARRAFLPADAPAEARGLGLPVTGGRTRSGSPGRTPSR